MQGVRQLATMTFQNLTQNNIGTSVPMFNDATGKGGLCAFLILISEQLILVSVLVSVRILASGLVSVDPTDTDTTYAS